jgi:tripartite-type tricarboxylate transporter receptor subunit TctC
MKKIILAFLGALTFTVNASELIKIYNPYSASHSGTPALLRVIEQANQSQNIYKFVVEFKPGGNQIIAVKSLDANSLAIIAPAYVENIESGKLNEKDYVPVHAFGDACWAVITNGPLEGTKEVTVGGVGFGNAAHLTALALGEKYKFNVRYVIFRSNNDALVNMTGNNGVEFVVEKYESYEGLQTKNNNLRMIAASCPKRLPQAPKVKTLKELGIEAPYVFNITVATTEMPAARRVAISKILDDATVKVGELEIFKLSAMRPPIFDNVSTEEFYTKSVSLVKNLQKKYRDNIEESKK